MNSADKLIQTLHYYAQKTSLCPCRSEEFLDENIQIFHFSSVI